MIAIVVVACPVLTDDSKIPPYHKHIHPTMKPTMQKLTNDWPGVAGTDSSLLFQARDLLGRAFCWQEPLFGWFLDLIPDKMREPVAIFCMSFPVQEAVYRGGTIVGTRTSAGELGACVILREYDASTEQGFWNSVIKTAINIFTFLLIAWCEGVPKFFSSSEYKAQNKQFEKAGSQFADELKRWHKEHGLSGRHWYIGLLAVAKSSQGKGLGRRVMSHVHKTADACQMPCYLETKGQRRVQFYSSMGYETVSEKSFEDPVDPSRTLSGIILMIRPPLKC